MEKNTPLTKEHEKLNALIAPFGQWNMPIHYGSIIEEALHTRKETSIFDISHMGEFIINDNPVKSLLDPAITVSTLTMDINSCRYGFLLNENGTILDDLIVYRLKEDQWMLVVNSANEVSDEFFLCNRIPKDSQVKNISEETAKIDIQGPGSMDVLIQIAGDEIKDLTYYTHNKFKMYDDEVIISRTGYTGELGYEIYISTDRVSDLWNDLLKIKNVKPAGLGARDILRVEMGYPLYGAELSDEMNPIDTTMDRFIDMEKDFYGKRGLINYTPERILTGFIIDSRRKPVPNKNIIINGENSGYISSGVFSPHLNKGIGLGFIDKDKIKEGTEIEVETGKALIKGKINKTPFIKKTSLKKEQ